MGFDVSDLVMGKSSSENGRHQQHSTILAPRDNRGMAQQAEKQL